MRRAMLASFVVAVLATTVLLLSAQAVPSMGTPKLIGTVGPGFNITLKRDEVGDSDADEGNLEGLLLRSPDGRGQVLHGHVLIESHATPAALVHQGGRVAGELGC